MEGPQATETDTEDRESSTRFNPVLEALDALEDLKRMADTVHMETDTRIQARGALAIGWSLLASVTGGATIDIGEKPKDQPGNLENAAKAAFGG